MQSRGLVLYSPDSRQRWGGLLASLKAYLWGVISKLLRGGLCIAKR